MEKEIILLKNIILNNESYSTAISIGKIILPDQNIDSIINSIIKDEIINKFTSSYININLTLEQIRDFFNNLIFDYESEEEYLTSILKSLVKENRLIQNDNETYQLPLCDKLQVLRDYIDRNYKFHIVYDIQENKMIIKSKIMFDQLDRICVKMTNEKIIEIYVKSICDRFDKITNTELTLLSGISSNVLWSICEKIKDIYKCDDVFIMVIGSDLGDWI